MKYVPIREMQVDAGPVLTALREGEHEVVLTAQGDPVALLVSVTSDDLDDTLRMVRQARAQATVSRLRARARQVRSDELELEEIDDEIRAARASRSRQ